MSRERGRAEDLRAADARAGFPSRLTLGKKGRWLVRGCPRLSALLLEGELAAGEATAWALLRTGRAVREVPLPEAGDVLTLTSGQNTVTLDVDEVSGWPERRVATFRMQATVVATGPLGQAEGDVHIQV